MMIKLFFLFITSVALTSASNDVQEVVEANNLFAQKLYQEIIKGNDKNLLISPFSASVILALVRHGANGATADEITTVLNVTNTNGFKTIISSLNNDNYVLKSANKIYLKNGFSIKPTFQQIATEVFDSTIEPINFIQNVEAAKTINQWVEDNTNNKIHDLVQADDLDKFTRSVLVNALYFQANWSNPFLLAHTTPKTFHKNINEKVEVPFLNQDEEFYKYLECPHTSAQFLELPFKGGEATMTIVLPQEKSLAKLESNLEMVFKPVHNLTTTFVDVAIPKFKIESSIDLKEILSNIGVRKLFDDDEADLSNLSGNKGDLVVNKAKQKTFIDVSEGGVEAAASTFFLVAVPQSAIMGTPKSFVADRPFIYYIKVKDVIVFAGRITDPSQK